MTDRVITEDDEKFEDVSPCYHISFNDKDPQEDGDAKDTPSELEEGVKTTMDAFKEVNLGTDEEPWPTYLSALLSTDEEKTYTELLKEFKDVFAWSYKEMPGLDPKAVVHHLAVKNGARPVKQAQRRYRPDLVPLIESEVNKLIEAGFIRKVKYPTWVSSIVPVRKKTGQIRVFVDFRDLNDACPKDEFPLPIPELMIDATTTYEAMSFMEGSSGYYQIRMAPKDEELTAFRTPRLVVNQLLGSYEVKKPELRPYHNYAKTLMGWVDDATIQLIPRKESKKTDTLVALASSLSLPNQAQVTIYQKWAVPPPNKGESEENELEHLVAVSEAEKEEWRQPIIDYLSYMILPENLRIRTEIRRRAPRFLYYKDTLYRRSFEGILLRCLGKDEALQALQEAHYGPPEVLYPTVASWPFDAWGLDVVGPLPKSSDGHLYILATTDYFSKWAEDVALKEVKKDNVASFIRVNIIYRFGITHYIIMDNGKPFDNRLMNKICDLFGFQQRNSSMYNIAANDLAEAFNKNLCKLLKKVVSESKRYWHDRITDEENARLLLAELEAVDEKRLKAQQSLECYQARLSCTFSKRVLPRSFQVGDQVLVKRRPIITSHKPVGKFTSKWDGPYVVQEAYSSGAYKLVDANCMRIRLINDKFLKKYCP
ncbi:uncharacterized protein [Nicotiana tomentosiformis]|uniref:uncharacterized protein n=1 Tax=Nicotiana tomentosiformis TaxID=4098 RepID=UPI00388C8F61